MEGFLISDHVQIVLSSDPRIIDSLPNNRQAHDVADASQNCNNSSHTKRYVFAAHVNQSQNERQDTDHNRGPKERHLRSAGFEGLSWVLELLGVVGYGCLATHCVGPLALDVPERSLSCQATEHNVLLVEDTACKPDVLWLSSQHFQYV